LQVAFKGLRWTAPNRAARIVVGLAAAAAASFAGIRATEDAIPNGDTRTLTILHTHTGESASVTFRRNGRYDGEALNQLNWILRDWRTDRTTKMDPRLFDIVWEVYREVGAREPINVLSAYRAPETNAMLRRRSRGVSEHSQHMVGKAMDFRLPDVDMGRVRAIAMRLQHGGVGYYPSSGFVHLDVGSVRAWPRMTQDQLARLFPDGKTVHLPSNGKPFARYEEARAEILSRGGAVSGYAPDGGGSRRSLWATLFGGGDEDTEYYGGQGRNGRTHVAAAEAPASSSSLRFFWQKDPVPPASAEPATTQEPLHTAALAPIPPRRPDEISALAAVPMPPARPLELAAAFAPANGARSAPAEGDRAALRALFAAAMIASPAPAPARTAPVVTSRATPQPALETSVVADLGPALNLRFSSAPTGDLSATAFTGPAVKPLPVLR